MEVQGAAPLDLGDLAVRDACVVGEFAAGESGAGGEALPQAARVVVEENGARVVVGGGRVEGSAEYEVIGGVAGAAAADPVKRQPRREKALIPAG